MRVGRAGRRDGTRRSRSGRSARSRGLRISPHRPDRALRTDLDFRGHLEAVTLVERNVPDVARFQVRAEALAVATIEDLAHEIGAEAFALMSSLRAEDEEVEVRNVLRVVLGDAQQSGSDFLGPS